MINEEVVEHYNNRLTYTPSSKLTPSQKDQIKHYGSQAEELITNKALAMFIHHYRFEINDALVNITTHTQEANTQRIALANHLSGLDGFISCLKTAIFNRDKLVSQDSAMLNKQPG